MKNETYQEIELARRSVNWGLFKTVFLALFLIGAAAFIYGIAAWDAKRAWSAYLVNYVYWTGIAFGAFLLSPILVATNATWGRPVKRVAESVAFFLPVSFVLLWPLYAGKENVFWWVTHPEPQKAPWLNVPFFFAREGIGLLVLTGTALLFIYHSVKSDLEVAENRSAEIGHRVKSQLMLAPIFIILYAFILSLVSFDMIMSLSPEWFSTLFGAYYFMISFYAGLSFVIIVSARMVINMGLGNLIEKKQLHDLGKLLFAFCVVSTDFFYVQFLVIWYGNLPEETRYVIARVMSDPWTTLAWTVLLVTFVIPFFVLLFRNLKMNPLFMTFMSIWILCGVWLEKFLLVTPSMLKSESVPLGFMEILITLGWLGLFGYCVCSFLSRYPTVAFSDPKLGRALEPAAEELRVI